MSFWQKAKRVSLSMSVLALAACSTTNTFTTQVNVFQDWPSNAQGKSYAFSKIDRLLVLPDTFTPDPAVVQKLNEEDSIWLNLQKTEVVLKVAKPAAGYFERRKLIGGQKIEKTLADGGLIVSGSIAHPNQILPIIAAMQPDFTEVEEATEILVAAQDNAWGPIQHKGRLHDRASYRYYWELLQRARNTGMELPGEARQRFFAL